MRQRMSGAQVFLKSNPAHHGRDLHRAAGFKIASILDGTRQRLGYQVDALQGNRIAQWVIYG